LISLSFLVDTAAPDRGYWIGVHKVDPGEAALMGARAGVPCAHHACRFAAPRLFAVVFTALFFVVHSLVAQAAPWDTKFFNPQPLADDLSLPMPCGGKMAFRAISTEGVAALADRRVVLGNATEALGYAEHPRVAHIAGAFGKDGRPAPDIYWLGKYEVSRLQWHAVMDFCLKPSTRARIPVSGVNWFDAVRFAQTYSAWLYSNAYDQLPKAGNTRGFVRLSTEAEWEFAVRGGASVSREAFKAARVPMPEGVSRYAWHAGSKSAGGKLRPTGLLLANPLGLHDMLGNAEEIVLEPFRLHKTIRLHGQAGGFITKGGHYFSTAEKLRSAYRREYAHFDQSKRAPTEVATVGFRVVVGAVAIQSHEHLQQIKKSWHTLPGTARR
jgi:formylglycine-generating enzyme required for sulfatase activity